MTRSNGVLLTALLLAATACVPRLTPYQMEIQQGNVVTQEMLAKLKPGMTPSQVRFILGTPLVVDAFHKNRWDYVYRYSKGGTVHEHRRIVVVFDDEKLARIEGDVVPARTSATEGGVKIDKGAPAGPAGAKAEPRPKPAPGAAAPPPEASRLVTTTGEPVAGGGEDAQAAAKAKQDKPREEKPQAERGFFGRMLEKLGF